MKVNTTLVGTVGTDPTSGVLNDGRPFVNFRVAVNERRLDRSTGEWIEGEASWFDVSAYDALASNAASCVHKGDSLIVAGELQVRSWQNETRTGISVQLVARSMGHNLRFGTANYARSRASSRLKEGDRPGEGETDSGGSAWGSVPPAEAASAEAAGDSSLAHDTTGAAQPAVVAASAAGGAEPPF